MTFSVCELRPVKLRSPLDRPYPEQLCVPRHMQTILVTGMLLSAIHNVNGEEKLNLVMLDDAIPAGAKLY